MDFKLTVIIPNYNSAGYLSETIESALRQKTDFDYKIVITDDHSTKDNSVDIIQQYAELYPDKIIALLNNDNGKTLLNTLRAKRLTDTDYFTVLDSDDYWTDECYLQDAYNFLEAHHDFTIYARSVTIRTSDGEERPYFPPEWPDADYELRDWVNGYIPVPQTAGAVFRNVIFKHGIPDFMTNAVGTMFERVYEGDTARFFLHLKHGKAHIENRSSAIYRYHAQGIWSRLNLFQQQILNALFPVVFSTHFEKEHTAAILQKAHHEWLSALETLKTTQEKIDIPERYKEMFFYVFEKCMEHGVFCAPAKPASAAEAKQARRPEGLRHRLIYKIYKHCKKKLERKGYL